MLEPILEKIISKEGERESKIQFSSLSQLETFCILLPQASWIFMVHAQMKAVLIILLKVVKNSLT